MRVLYVASQAKPYIDISDLGDIASSLPRALNRAGVDTRIILPLFAKTRKEHEGEFTKIASYEANIAGSDKDAVLYTTKHCGMTYYFIENDKYFGHFGFYGTLFDAERFAFFCKAVINALPFMGEWIPDVIHCNNWECGAIPIYLRAFCRQDRYYSKIKTAFTIHNIEYQGEYDIKMASDILGISSDKIPMAEHNGKCNFMKAAIDQCDVVTTVSGSYAAELLDPYHGLGMEKVLKERKYKFTGILNGIDYDEYNPKSNVDIPFAFDENCLENKAKNKKALQEELGLNQCSDCMLIGIVASMASRKGLELVEAAERKLMGMNVQLAILGVGQVKYVDFFKRMQKLYPGKVTMINEYNTGLSKKIYAGADVILLPCKTEPCGLTQMKALRYGAIPIVRKVGGLKDTITDVSCPGGNGFTFETYSEKDMLDAIERAYEHFTEGGWDNIVRSAMKCDFSWDNSASIYKKLYSIILR